MKPKFLAVLILLLLCASAAFFYARRNQLRSVSLIDDFPYVHKQHPNGKKDFFDATTAGELLQNTNGNQHFFALIPDQASLFYSLKAEAKDVLTASIVIESDYPVPLRSEAAVRTGDHTVPLKEFSGRVARITIQASIAKPVLWKALRIEYPENASNKKESKAFEPFRQRHSRDNVLMILLDAASAFHFREYGYSRDTTPNISALAKESVLFQNAVTQAVYTLASVATIFTGIYPDGHGVLVKPNALAPGQATIAEYFQQRGYKTALISASPNISPVFGFNQGFQFVQRSAFTADQIVPVFQKWESTPGNAPFFAYLHFREPHEPYDPPAEFLTKYSKPSAPGPKLSFENGNLVEENKQQIIDGYDGNLAFVDAQVGRILQSLRSSDQWNHTIVMVMADHGEAFWEHGERGHNSQMYEQMLRVPLIVRFPDEPKLQGKHIDPVVGLIDLMPTLLDLFDLKSEKRLDGESLLPLLLEPQSDVVPNPGTEPTGRSLMSQTTEQNVYCLRGHDWKYICHPNGGAVRDEFYLLHDDPDERENRIKQYPVFCAYQRMEIQKAIKRLRAESDARNVNVDQQTEDELRSLGYVN